MGSKEGLSSLPVINPIMGNEVSRERVTGEEGEI